MKQSSRSWAWRIAVVALVGLPVFGCSADSASNTTEPPATIPASSFGQIQRLIFDQQCVRCHTKNGSAVSESGLVLDAGVSYTNLVGAQSRQATARGEGMYRVLPRDPGRSLLFHKLNWNPDHHAGKSYGSPMPLGSEPLTIGQLEFIRRWIDYGAPLEGFVVDSTLLQDTRKQYIEPFVPLPPPAQGYQLRIDSFAVAPNFERELFVFKRVGNTTTEYVSRIETRMRVNSHHFLALTFADSTPANVIPAYNVVRDIRAPDGSMILSNMLMMGWQNFYAGANTPYENKVLPAGVALELPANTSLDLNSHYINTTNVPLPGEVYVNFHTVPASQVQKVARPFSFPNYGLALPPNARTTVTYTAQFDRTTTIIMLTSHNHSMGEKFVIKIAGGPRDGEVVYTSTDWQHPVILWLTDPIVLQKGEGLTSVVTYFNRTSQTLYHGLLSTDEMDIMRGYAY
jgi:hypothetical protein